VKSALTVVVIILSLAAAAVAGAQTAAPAQEPPKPAPAPEAAKPPAQGLEFSIGDWKVKFYGFVRLDAHYDDSHPNNTQLISFIRPEEELPLPTSAFEEENSEDFTIHARLTRFGVDVNGPPVSMLGDARAMGKIEFDFLANGGSEATTTSRGVIRMRLAYLKLSWEEISVLAGQNWDIFAPLLPSTSGEFSLWGAGNVGDRRPMVMGDFRRSFGDLTVILQGGAGLGGAIDGENLDGSGTRDGEASGRPCFQGRAALKLAHPWVEKKSCEVGISGNIAREHLDTIPTAWTGEDEDDFACEATAVDATIPIFDFLSVRGEVWWGRNANDLRGGIGQGVAFVDGDAGEVPSRGYWGEVLVKPLDWYTVGVGTSRDNPDNSRVSRTIAISPASGAEDNRTGYLFNRFNVGAGLSFGLDYTHWITKWRGGDYEGTDNRFSFFAQYNF